MTGRDEALMALLRSRVQQSGFDCLCELGTGDGFDRGWLLDSRIRSQEDFAAEERQRGLSFLPARDPRFPQPPIYLCDKIL